MTEQQKKRAIKAAIEIQDEASTLEWCLEKGACVGNDYQSLLAYIRSINVGLNTLVAIANGIDNHVTIK